VLPINKRSLKTLSLLMVYSMKSVSGSKKQLRMLLKKITHQNLPDTKEGFGRSVGREAWRLSKDEPKR
jgi:hypothetical protein